MLLNAFIILAIKQRRVLQKPSNIMLSSLAVTDLLVGIIAMPTSATIDFFTFSQVSFEHTCMLHAVNLFFFPLLFSATLHQLERHCLGEVRGCAKMDELQSYHYKWPAQEDCDSYLALCALPNGCKLYYASGL